MIEERTILIYKSVTEYKNRTDKSYFFWLRGNNDNDLAGLVCDNFQSVLEHSLNNIMFFNRPKRPYEPNIVIKSVTYGLPSGLFSVDGGNYNLSMDALEDAANALDALGILSKQEAYEIEAENATQFIRKYHTELDTVQKIACGVIRPGVLN